MIVKVNNPYLISFTAGGLLYDEFISLYSFLNEDKINSITKEIKTNNFLKTNSQAARQRIIQEVRKRYNAVSNNAFLNFLDLSQNEQKIFLFYTCLKTYSIIFDFIFDVIIEKWLSRDVTVDKSTVLFFLDQQSATHMEIEDWKDTTIQKVASVMVRILNEVGILQNGELQPLEAGNTFWYNFIEYGDPWFLQACLLNKNKRTEILNA